MERDGLRHAVVALGAITLMLLAVVIVSGVELAQEYRPVAAGARFATLDPPVRAARSAVRVHRQAASMFTLSAFAFAVAAVASAVRSRRLTNGASAIVFVLLVVVAGASGYLLPWDQLALWAVTVGTDIKGVWPAAFSDSVRFVIIGNREIAQRTYARALVAHLLVLPALVVVAGSGAVARLRRPRRSTPVR